jgi:hypothetical protein
MAGIDPPYSAPTYTLASNTMATVGSMPTVKGKSKAMAMEGEIPGNAPPKIPQSTPPKAAKKTDRVAKVATVERKLSMKIFLSKAQAPQNPAGMRTRKT